MKKSYFNSLNIHVDLFNVEIQVEKLPTVTLWLPLAIILFPVFLTLLTPILIVLFFLSLFMFFFRSETFAEPSDEEITAYYEQGKDYISNLSEQEKAELFRKKEDLPLGL